MGTLISSPNPIWLLSFNTTDLKGLSANLTFLRFRPSTERTFNGCFCFLEKASRSNQKLSTKSHSSNSLPWRSDIELLILLLHFLIVVFGYLRKFLSAYQPLLNYPFNLQTFHTLHGDLLLRHFTLSHFGDHWHLIWYDGDWMESTEEYFA